MRVLVIALLALVASTAGCLDGNTVANVLTGSDENEAADDASEADASLDVDEVTADGGDGTDAVLVLDEPVTNAAPAASLSVSATRGHAPMFAIFTINAFDPDGDELFWSLDVNGDGTPEATGTELPGRFEGTLASAGSFVATLSVTDGEQTVHEQVVIQVESAAEPEATAATTPCPPCIVLVPDPDLSADLITPDTFEDIPPAPPVPPNFLDFNGTVAIFCTICTEEGPGASLSWNLAMPGFDTVWVELPAAAQGRPFLVTSQGLPLADPDAAFMSACAPDATVVTTSAAGGPEAGTVPAGAGCLVAWEWVGVGNTPGTTIFIAVV